MGTATEPVTVPVLLYALAEAVARRDLPLPWRMYQYPDMNVCDIDTATREDLDRWCAFLGIDPGEVRSQPYDRDDVPKVLTNAYGSWLGWRIDLSCCIPATTATTAATVAA